MSRRLEIATFDEVCVNVSWCSAVVSTGWSTRSELKKAERIGESGDSCIYLCQYRVIYC